MWLKELGIQRHVDSLAGYHDAPERQLRVKFGAEGKRPATFRRARRCAFGSRARTVQIGQGSSVEIGFDLAPQNRWPDVSAFDAHRGEPAAAPADADGVVDNGDAWG